MTFNLTHRLLNHFKSDTGGVEFVVISYKNVPSNSLRTSFTDTMIAEINIEVKCHTKQTLAKRRLSAQVCLFFMWPGKTRHELKRTLWKAGTCSCVKCPSISWVKNTRSSTNSTGLLLGQEIKTERQYKRKTSKLSSAQFYSTSVLRIAMSQQSLDLTSSIMDIVLHIPHNCRQLLACLRLFEQTAFYHTKPICGRYYSHRSYIYHSHCLAQATSLKMEMYLEESILK